MKRTEILDTVTTICALVVTVAVLRSLVFKRPAPAAGEDVLVPGWDTLAMAGTLLAPVDSAGVFITVFSDYECPACERLATTAIKPAIVAYPGRVAVRYRHWPLSYHRFAYPMALAAECANEQGKFRAFHDLAFEKQDSLGFKPIEEYARDAGLSDLSRFRLCLAEPIHRVKIDADIRTAESIGGQGTPVVVIDGWRLASPPDSAKLDRMIRERLKGT